MKKLIGLALAFIISWRVWMNKWHLPHWLVPTCDGAVQDTRETHGRGPTFLCPLHLRGCNYTLLTDPLLTLIGPWPTIPFIFITVLNVT